MTDSIFLFRTNERTDKQHTDKPVSGYESTYVGKLHFSSTPNLLQDGRAICTLSKSC